MIILGIDPAIRTTGYGVIKVTGASSFEIIDCGVIVNSPKMLHSECLRRLAGGIRQLIDEFKPECASIEEPFLGRNASTAIILGMARGAIISVLAEKNIDTFSYAPRKAKQFATGFGGASKEQIALILSAELNIETSLINLDSTDALALAICHAQMLKNQIISENLIRKV